jgi:hypothetical protein
MGFLDKFKGKSAKKLPPPPPLPLPAPAPWMATVVENIEKPSKVIIANGFFSYGSVAIQTRSIAAFSITSTSNTTDNKKSQLPHILRWVSNVVLTALFLGVVFKAEIGPFLIDFLMPPPEWVEFMGGLYGRLMMAVVFAAAWWLRYVAFKKDKSFVAKKTTSRFFFEVQLTSPRRLSFTCPSKDFADDLLKKIQSGIEHGRIKIVADFEGKKISVETVQ